MHEPTLGHHPALRGSGRRFRILHISDLHERAEFDGMPKSRGPKLALDAEHRGYVLGERFYKALREVAAGGIDIVAFTGDLADWGHPAEYAVATTRLITILEATGVRHNRFFAVPGNHDVQRGIETEAWQGLLHWLRDGGDRARLGRWFRDVQGPPAGVQAAWRDALLRRTGSFWSWLESFGCGDLRPQAPTLLGYRKTLAPGSFEDVEVPVHIIGLDSAWLCGGETDQGHILVTDEQVQAHIRRGEQSLGGLRIAIIHHPLDHLADHHQVRRLLADDGVDLLLHGHQHTPLAMDAIEPGAGLRILAAGCLIEGDLGKEWPNGFQVIDVDPVTKAVAIHFRKWSESGRFWSVGSDLYRDAPDGTLELPARGLDDDVRRPTRTPAQDAHARQLPGRVLEALAGHYGTHNAVVGLFRRCGLAGHRVPSADEPLALWEEVWQITTADEFQRLVREASDRFRRDAVLLAWLAGERV